MVIDGINAPLVASTVESSALHIICRCAAHLHAARLIQASCRALGRGSRDNCIELLPKVECSVVTVLHALAASACTSWHHSHKAALQAEGITTDYNNYLTAPGFCDIFFPTNFAALAQLHKQAAHEQGSAGLPDSESTLLKQGMLQVHDGLWVRAWGWAAVYQMCSDDLLATIH